MVLLCGSFTEDPHYKVYRINNKILDCDWSSAHLLLMKLLHGCDGVQLKLSNYNFP